MTIDYIIPIFIAAALLLVPNLRFIYVKMRYVKVHAVCASVNFNHDSDGDHYQPLWEYNYDGTTYHTLQSWSTNARYYIGEETELYICPKKPKRIYIGSVGAQIGYTIIILIFILIGAFILTR